MSLIQEVSEFLYYIFTTSCGVHKSARKLVVITEFHDTALCHEIWYTGPESPDKKSLFDRFRGPT
jgi:hypothetical protein